MTARPPNGTDREPLASPRGLEKMLKGVDAGMWEELVFAIIEDAASGRWGRSAKQVSVPRT